MSDETGTSDEIEGIVGAKRHQVAHIGRAVSAEQTVYILHSGDCKAFYEDLRDCPFSKALDRGIDLEDWLEDQPVQVRLRDGLLIGVTPWQEVEQ